MNKTNSLKATAVFSHTTNLKFMVSYFNNKIPFFVALNKEWNNLKVPRMKKRKTLPVVLSKSEVKEFLDSIDNLRYKTIFSVIYSGGLRLSEVAKLKVTDIDSNDMKIIVRDGK